MIITLRRDAQHTLASLHDLEVRAGPTAPSVGMDPAAANLRCALRAGQLGTAGGQRLTLACSAKLTARYVTLQIRWVGWGGARCLLPPLLPARAVLPPLPASVGKLDGHLPLGQIPRHAEHPPPLGICGLSQEQGGSVQ